MSSTLSLKTHQENNSLKDQILSLQNEIKALHEKNAAQVDVEKKLDNEIVNLKEDYVHLEEQFDVFATLEQDHEMLQQEIQLERLANVVERDKVKGQFQEKLKTAQQETTLANSELKKIKAMDPARLKRQVADGKKKAATQRAANEALKAQLNKVREELKKSKAEGEQSKLELDASRNETDNFWLSENGAWSLSLTGFDFKDEETKASDKKSSTKNSESSTKKGKGSSTVKGKESSTVKGKESSTIKGKESSTIKGKESSTIKGKESSTVKGKESSTIKGKESKDELSKVRCLNRETGVSFVSKELNDDQCVVWGGAGADEVPSEVSKAAGAEIVKIAEENSEDESAEK